MGYWKDDEGCFVIFMKFIIVFCLLYGLGYVLKVIDPFGDAPETEIVVARDIKTDLEPRECDFSYLGVYEVENYGKMELFCENGEYFGEIPGKFSIAMTRKKDYGVFQTLFCLYDTCYAHPITLEDGILVDVYGKYFSAEKMQ